MSYLNQLLENKEVTHVRNENAPKGCFVSIERRSADGKVEGFITRYGNKTNVRESADFKSSYMKNESSHWVDYTKEGSLILEGSKPKVEGEPVVVEILEKVETVRKWLKAIPEEKVNRYNFLKGYMQPKGIVLTDVGAWLSATDDKSKAGVAMFIDELLVAIK
jgi:hypothetical protein